MKNLSMYCLTLEPEHEEKIKALTYIPVGLHGAGFANFSFCKPETMVLELKPNTAGPVCATLARSLNLNYKEISKPSKNPSFINQQGNIEIPLDELKSKIR